MPSLPSPRVLLLLAGITNLVACAQVEPVEFSLTGADAGVQSQAGDLDFRPMDRTIAACKQRAKDAGASKCAQVRAYESCMKGKGYLTILGPENPQGCGDPAWEKDARKWLQ